MKVYWFACLLFVPAVAAGTTASIESQLARLVRPPLEMNIKGDTLSLLPLLDGMASTIAVRHITASFAVASDEWQRLLLPSEDGNEHTGGARSAFRLEKPPTLTPAQRRMLENDLSELVRLLAVQEKSHRFHLAAGVRPRTSTAPRVRVIDSEDPTLVRADCDTRSIEISTGFLRRLLEAAVESVNSGERMPERPEWYTEELGNWPPAVASLYDLQKHYYSATATVSLGPKMMAIVHQLALLDREVLPAAEAALRKTGFDGAFAEYAARFEPQSRSTYEPAIRAARSLQLPPRVAKRLVQISTRIREYEASFETDPEAEREFESFITQYQGGFEDAAEAISLLTLYTMMVEQEYLKALAFAVAHEGAHIWFIGCERDVDNENRADAYGALVAFEMFSNHHRKLNVRSNAKLVLPLPFGDDQTSDVGDFDALEWFVRATGRSGVELMVSVYRDVKGVDPASHASFESRREAVSELYRNLVATTVRTTAQ